jgi:ABC-type spermidine/putrescine transport system permease subunit II
VGWELKTPMGVFNISDVLNGKISPLLEDHADKNKWLNSALMTVLLLIFFLIPLIAFWVFSATSAEQDICTNPIFTLRMFLHFFAKILSLIKN